MLKLSSAERESFDTPDDEVPIPTDEYPLFRAWDLAPGSTEMWHGTVSYDREGNDLLRGGSKFSGTNVNVL